MWCFTKQADEVTSIVWNEATAQFPPLHWADRKYFRYCKYQVERAPTTGMVHLQGYLCLTRALRLSELKRHYDPEAHWEQSRGTIEDNDKYVSKEESKVAGPFELGNKPEGGASVTKHRWADVQAMAKQGLTRDQILMAIPVLAPQVRGIDALIQATRPQPEISREIAVFFLTGPTGVGKTHHALTHFPEAFLIRGKYQEGKSFDQYDYQKTLILDEWSPYEWPLTLMNTLTDKWKCPLTCRYSNKYAFWTCVVITTNVTLEECYPACLQLQRDSFTRRVTRVIPIAERMETLAWGDGIQAPTADVVPTDTLTAAPVPTDPNGSPIIVLSDSEDE